MEAERFTIYVWLLYCPDSNKLRCEDIEQIILLIEKVFSVYSVVVKYRAKNTSLQSKLVTLACCSWEKREERCEANQLFFKAPV